MNISFFGTDGIRGAMGTEPLTPESLLQLGKAIGQWIHIKNQHARILIATDTRLSASLCKSALKTGLLLFPFSIEDAGVVPTPVIHHALKDGQYDYGIVLTASHNQFQDNGIKIVTAHGKITTEDEASIMHFFNTPYTADYHALGSDTPLLTVPQMYQERLDRYFTGSFLKHCSLVIDTANGAYSHCAAKIFEHFGATVKVINNAPTGININKECGSLHPQTLQDTVVRIRADAGFAFDGDGDRIIAVGSDGAIKDGDDILCFLLKHPRYKTSAHIVGTIISNQGLAQHLESTGRSLIRTAVGDKHIIEALKKEQLNLGGEPSGHIIMRDFSECPDGLFTALRIAETALLTHDWKLTSFTKFPHVSKNIHISEKKDLHKEPLATIIKTNEDAFIGGRLIIRYSGTEPILRIVAEGPSLQDAELCVNNLCAELQKHFTEEKI